MQKKTVILGGAALFGLVGLGTWLFLRNQSSVQYRTAAVVHGDINVTISATGNPNAVVAVQVGSQVSGIVMALFADFNTKVTKGELIAQIEPSPFQAKVNQAQANVDAARAAVANAQAVVQQALAGIQAANSALAAAKANVVKAQSITEDDKVKVDRRVVMFKQGADSKEDLETAQTTYKSAIADHDALVAQQHAVEDNLKVAQAQLNVANSILSANQSQVKQFAPRCSHARSTWTTPRSPHRSLEWWHRGTWMWDKRSRPRKMKYRPCRWIAPSPSRPAEKSSSARLPVCGKAAWSRSTQFISTGCPRSITTNSFGANGRSVA